MSRRVPFVVLALMAATLLAPAATTPTVDEIVARYLSTRGGLAKIRAIQTLRQTGHASAGASRKAIVTRELKRPSRTRFEFTVQGITGVYISDGVRGWEASPFDGDGTPRPLAEEVVAEAAEQADIEGPLVEWKLKGHRLELLGREAVAGRDAYKLKLTLKSGAVRHEYIDVKSRVIVRTDSTRQVRGRDVPIETTFADYKRVGGVLFPHRIEITAAGRPQPLSVVVDKIEVNPPLGDGRFEISGLK